MTTQGKKDKKHSNGNGSENVESTLEIDSGDMIEIDKTKGSKETKELKEMKDTKEIKVTKDLNDAKEAKAAKDKKEVKEVKEVKDVVETKEPVATKEVPSVTKEDKKLDLLSFFDILAQMEIILRTDTSLKLVSGFCPYNSVRAGDLAMSTVSSLPMQFSVFIAGDDKSPWICTKFPTLNAFSDFDAYLVAIWNLINEKLKAACCVLLCPNSTVWVNRNPNPTYLGYPVDLIMEANARRADDVAAIIDAINLRDRDATKVDVTVCGESSILQVSSNLIQYSLIQMRALRDVAQHVLNLNSNNIRSSKILPFNSITTNFCPLFDFRIVGYIYRALPLYVHLAFELAVSAISPVVPIQPISDSVIIKQATASFTRSGFLSDVTSVIYSANMASDFSVIVSTLLAPGYAQVVIDWDDVPSEAVEMRGMIAILCKAIFMRSNGTLDSISDESARRVEDVIVTLGIRNNLFIRSPHPDPNNYPLNNVNASRRLAMDTLIGMRTNLDGNGWMNSNRNVRRMDGWDGIYAPPIEPRPEYAVNCSDYDWYLDNENFVRQEWQILRYLEEFINAWAMKNRTLAEVAIMYLINILKWIIRMNEYLRTNWYTGLRLPNDIVARLVGAEKNLQCLKIPIKSRSILAFARSIGSGNSYTRQSNIIQQLKVESNVVMHASQLRAFVNALVYEVAHFGVADEYGAGKRWRMALDSIPDAANPLIYHLKALESRRMLSALPRNYLYEMEASDLYIAIYPDLLRSVRLNSEQSGFVRSFFYKSTNYDINTRETLLRLATTGNVKYADVERFQNDPIPVISVPNQLRAWMRAVEPRYNLDVQSSLTFLEIQLPLAFSIDFNSGYPSNQFPLCFTFPDTNRKLSNSVAFRKYDFGVLKITSNEIRQPDHVVPLAVAVEPLALRSGTFRNTFMPLEDFLARIAEFRVRVTIFRDHSATFTNLLTDLSV